MRLFLALDLPVDARRELAAWRDAELRERTDLRPVDEEALHVTLVFMGSKPEDTVAALDEVERQLRSGSRRITRLLRDLERRS